MVSCKRWFTVLYTVFVVFYSPQQMQKISWKKLLCISFRKDFCFCRKSWKNLMQMFLFHSFNQKKKNIFTNYYFSKTTQTLLNSISYKNLFLMYPNHMLTDWFVRKNLRWHTCIYNVYYYWHNSGLFNYWRYKP